MMYQLGLRVGAWEEPVKVAERLVKKLERYRPFIFHISKERSSVYIHFRGLPNDLDHKLRVSTHEERERYGYKWQFRLDGVSGVEQPKRWSRYFDDEEKFLTCFMRYYDNVERSGENQNKVDFAEVGREYRERVNGHHQRDQERKRAHATAVEGSGL